MASERRIDRLLQGQLERAMTRDAAARQRLLELARDRLMRHARRLRHGCWSVRKE